jgi:hypothetical protein
VSRFLLWLPFHDTISPIDITRFATTHSFVEILRLKGKNIFDIYNSGTNLRIGRQCNPTKKVLTAYSEPGEDPANRLATLGIGMGFNASSASLYDTPLQTDGLILDENSGLLWSTGGRSDSTSSQRLSSSTSRTELSIRSLTTAITSTPTRRKRKASFSTSSSASPRKGPPTRAFDRKPIINYPLGFTDCESKDITDLLQDNSNLRATNMQLMTENEQLLGRIRYLEGQEQASEVAQTQNSDTPVGKSEGSTFGHLWKRTKLSSWSIF